MAGWIDPIVANTLVGGFSLLATSTLVVAYLKTAHRENPLFAKVWTIITGWWIIAVLLAIACCFGFQGLVCLFCLCSLLALKEFFAIQKLRFVGPLEWVCIVALTVCHYAFISVGWKNFYLFIVPVMSYVYLPFLFLSRRKIDGLVQNLWVVQSGIMLCVFFLSFAPALTFLNVNPTALRKIEPVAAFLFLFLVTELNDVFQFLSGKMFGRTKLIIEVSPNKTVAGFIGGIVLTSILAVLLAPAMLGLSLLQAALLGGCISLSGVSGDLMFSSIKRTAEVKDFSNLIPGHGGILDRLDSLVFTAPTLYCLLYIFIHVG